MKSSNMGWISMMKEDMNHKSKFTYTSIFAISFFNIDFEPYFSIYIYFSFLYSLIEDKLIPRKSIISYTREFLLSLSELDVCKKLPSGFNQSILRWATGYFFKIKFKDKVASFNWWWCHLCFLFAILSISFPLFH